MPGMDGFVVAERMWPSPRLTIMLLTSTRTACAARCRELAWPAIS
jgi:hypothetical protein